MPVFALRFDTGNDFSAHALKTFHIFYCYILELNLDLNKTKKKKQNFLMCLSVVYVDPEFDPELILLID